MSAPFLALFLFVLVGGSQFIATATLSERVWHGDEAVPHSAPWMVALHMVTQNQPQHCGGAIIAPNWVLTAAHCIIPTMFNVSNVVLVAGRHNVSAMEPSEQRRPVSEENVFLHPDFGFSPFLTNDIALIRVASGFEYNDKVRAIALPPKNYVHTGWARLHGWGLTEERVIPVALRTARLELLTHSRCSTIVPSNFLQKTQLCTGHEAGACTADSGGPLSQNGQIVGVVAFGTCPGGPSVFERVSVFTDWIADVLENEAL